MKALALFAVSGIILFTTRCYAQMPHSIIIGTVYNVFNEEFPTNQDYFNEVDRDVALMKKTNINHVMIFPMGEWNPETKKLDWTRTDYLVKKIEEAHMKFVPLLLKEEQCYDYFPIWEFREIPGMWKEYNLDNDMPDNRDNLDFDDPRVYPLVKNYFKAVIERYGKSPALSFYNIWNEPHYYSISPKVVAKFRGWLKKKYGSLAALRRSWGIEYSSWNQVSPFLTEDWKSSMPGIDWTLFRNYLNGALLHKLTKTLRKFDTVHPVNANPVGTTWANFSNFGNYNIDLWDIVPYENIVGMSYYPDAWERDHELKPVPYWLHNLTFNTIRSAAGKKPYILTELYTNAQNGLALNGYLTKSSVWLLAWTALANNCKGMIYWKWLPFMRGRQSLGRGLTRVDGTLASRGEAVKELGQVIKKFGPTLYKAQLEKPEVGILVDVVGLIKTLEQTVEKSTTKFMYESNAGLFKALYESDITSDMLRMDRGLTLAELERYKILFLPFQIVMRPATAQILKEYVRQGGWLVADARTATMNQLDFAYRTNPGAGLDSLFGMTSPDWIGAKNYFKVRVNGMNGEKPFTFEGKYFKEKVVPRKGAKVIGVYTDNGEPALIENKYGNGVAIMSGVPLGASYLDKPDNPVKKLIISLVEEAGVKPAAKFLSQAGSFVNLRVHKLEGLRIVYLINSQDKAKHGTLEVNVGTLKVRSVKDIISGQTYGFKQDGQRVKAEIGIQPDQVMVFFME